MNLPKKLFKNILPQFGIPLILVPSFIAISICTPTLLGSMIALHTGIVTMNIT
jgi:hypothetical protein